VALLTPSCSPPEAPDLQWNESPGLRWATSGPTGGDDGFSVRGSDDTGLTIENVFPDQELATNSVLANGSGVALGDFDADGWVDIAIPTIAGKIGLYRNLGGLRFEDVSRTAGVRGRDLRYSGATFADYEGDGDLDLFVAAIGGPLTLFRNSGDGTFSDVSAEVGLGEALGGSTIALADTDQDGDLDLYVANYKTRFAVDIFDGEDLGFDRVVEGEGPESRVRPEFSEHFALVFDSISGGYTLEDKAEPDWYFLNDGRGGFQRVPFTSGAFLDAAGHPLQTEPAHFGLSARFQDVDSDGDVDLYVCNDFQHPDRLWLNQGDGRFRSADPSDLRTIPLTSMGVDFSDVDRDGDVDFFVADMLSQDPVLRRRQIDLAGRMTKPLGRDPEVEQVARNTLSLNRGAGSFEEVGQAFGLEAADWAWAPLFLDVDLDGYEDLLVTNGFRWSANDGDVSERFTGIPAAADRHMFPMLETRNAAFRNVDGQRFVDARDEWGFGASPDISHGMAAADLDNDGDLDVVVNRWGAAPDLYRNDATAPRVSIRLRGRPPNTQAVGALITVRGGSVTQTKEVTAGGHYLSGGDTRYSFAVGDADALSVSVRWPSGETTDFEDIRVDRIYELFQPDMGERSADAQPDSLPALSKLFVDVSARLGGSGHVEKFYDDFARQPLLPYMMSRAGPGVSWGDLDGDGWEELLVAGGHGAAAVFDNEGGALKSRRMNPRESEVDQLLLFPTSRGSGHTEVLAVNSGYDLGGGYQPLRPAPTIVGLDTEDMSEVEYSVLSEDTVPPGAVAMADVDGDGRLDLFVGGRVIPGRFPAAPGARLYLDRQGAFVLDEGNEDLLGALGMASGAVFSDIDVDGDPDLVLAVDWGPIVILENEGGRFRDRTGEHGLGSVEGRWTGVASGDFNEDGRPDIVVTNLGDNSGMIASPENPISIYEIDLDRNGILDPLVTQFDTVLGEELAVAEFRTLRGAIPSLRNRIGSFEQYSTSSAADIAGAFLPRARRVRATTFQHLLLLSDESERGWEFVPLPRQAQFAAASSPVVGDFDGDGHDDLFLSQNFYPTRPGKGRMDAGLGLLMTGDGTGTLRPVPPVESGIWIPGDQRGAAKADFDHDGRLDLAVGQNSDHVHVLRNATGRPGIRVRLIGSRDNPWAIGAKVRPRYTDGALGAAQEVQSGGGYLSVDSPVLVFGNESEIVAFEVRWPGGEVIVEVREPAAREVAIRLGSAPVR